MKVYGQLEKAQIENLTVDPTGAALVPGLVWYRTDTKLYKVYDGTAIQTFADLTTAQTFVNKTLTSPVLTTPSSTGGTFATPAITNPTVTTGSFTDPALTNPTISPVANFTDQATTPDAPVAGVTKVYTKTNGRVYKLTSSNTELEIGSGASGSINFIADGAGNGDGAQIFSLATSSVIGTRPQATQNAGAANLTAGQTTILPLSSTQSFTISKAAVNAQGQNVYVPFTVDLAYRAKAVKISFDYIINSGTFQPGSNFGTVQDSDMIWYIYDVTNNVYIEPSNFRMLSNSTTISDNFQAEFQTSANGTSYRLIGHVATTSALAWSIKCDNFAVSPNEYVFGTPVTDELSSTVSLANFGATNIDVKCWRVGDKLKGRGHFRVGGPTAGLATITMPQGLSIKTSSQTVNQSHLFGTWVRGIDATQVALASNTVGPRVLVLNPSTPTVLGFASISNANGGASPSANFTVQAANAIVAANDQISFDFEVPIEGWSSSVQMSDQTDTRVVSMAYFKNGGAVSANSAYPSWTAGSDSHGAFNSATGVYTIPAAGDYNFSMSSYSNLAGQVVAAFVNGVAAFSSPTSANGTIGFSGTLRNLKAGDQVTMVNQTGSGITVSASNGTTFFSLVRASGPSQIAANELVSAAYYVSAGHTASTTSAINYDTRIFDSHGSVQTGSGIWRFTAPGNGRYLVSNSNVSSANTTMSIYKNGVAYANLNASLAAAVYSGTITIQLNAGEYIDIRPASSVTISGGLSNGYISHVSITRQGF